MPCCSTISGNSCLTVSQASVSAGRTQLPLVSTNVCKMAAAGPVAIAASGTFADFTAVAQPLADTRARARIPPVRSPATRPATVPEIFDNAPAKGERLLTVSGLVPSARSSSRKAPLARSSLSSSRYCFS